MLIFGLWLYVDYYLQCTVLVHYYSSTRTSTTVHYDTQLRTTLADALIIDALIAGRRFLPRHTPPHYTLTRAKPQIQLHNGK